MRLLAVWEPDSIYHMFHFGFFVKELCLHNIKVKVLSSRPESALYSNFKLNITQVRFFN